MVAQVRARGRAQRLAEWFLRRQVLEASHAQLPRRDELAGRAFEQARLLRDVARQAAAPIEPPPAGRRNAVLLSLYRDLVFWVLVAGGPSDGEVSPDLAGLWRQAPRDRLVRAAGSERNLEAVHGLLMDMSPVASLDTTEDDVARVRSFADRLYDELAAPRRRIVRIVAQRWIRLAGAAAVLVAIALGIQALAGGPNLALRAAMKLSSRLPDCAGDASCVGLMFHTNMEKDPWVEFDLGKPVPIRRVDVRNRPDCCQDRSIPLVVEIGTDGTHWKEVARQEKVFSNWKATFPRTPARYVRLRVTRQTYFGFADVTIR